MDSVLEVQQIFDKENEFFLQSLDLKGENENETPTAHNHATEELLLETESKDRLRENLTIRYKT
jgi:hypothetical protein